MNLLIILKWQLQEQNLLKFIELNDFNKVPNPNIFDF